MVVSLLFLMHFVLAHPRCSCRQTNLNKVHRRQHCHIGERAGHSSFLMAICGSSSKTGFGRRPVRQMPFCGAWCPGRVLIASTCFQIQRKVVVCGDGACGMYLCLTLFPASSARVHRQNVTTQCFHPGLLYPSIVSATRATPTFRASYTLQ